MGFIVLILWVFIISAVCSSLFYGKDSQTGRGKKKSEVCLQRYWADIIAAMLVYNREMTAAKRKLVDDFINNPKVCGSVSNADFWMLIEKQMIEPDNLDEALKLAAGKLALDERMKLAHLLFKLSVEDDGIMNDEWALLRRVTAGLNFSKTYVEHLTKFYGPLRSYSDTAIYNKVYGFVKQRKQSGNTGKADGASASASARTKGGTSSSYNRSSEQARSRTGSAGASAGGASQKAAPKVANSRLAQYYAVLGLPASASLREVQDAYHRLALQHHPDLPKNEGRQEECVKQMAKINVAYEFITSSLSSGS